MPDAATLQARITALETAFDRHELEVEFADRRVRYSSFDQISQQIQYFQRQLRSTLQRPRQYQAVGSKGLD